LPEILLPFFKSGDFPEMVLSDFGRWQFHFLGNIAVYGFWDASPQFFAMQWHDSLLMASLTDFMMVSLISIIWMYTETPPERRWKTNFII